MAATTPKHLNPAHAPFKLQRQRTACAAAFPQIKYQCRNRRTHLATVRTLTAKPSAAAA